MAFPIVSLTSALPRPLCSRAAHATPPFQCQSLRTQANLDVSLRRVPPCELECIKDDDGKADSDDDERGSSSCSSSDSSAGDSGSARYWWVYVC